MGQSTDAIIFYGFCWDEETSSPWNIGKDFEDDEDQDEDQDDDWEGRYARLKGLAEPTVKYPERRGKDGYSSPKDEEYTPEEMAAKKQHTGFWAAKRDLVDKLPVEVDTHCSGDCPMPMVLIKASKTRAWRGSPMEIVSLETKPEWEQELRAFCEFMGIDVKDQKPKWWLVSDWH